MTLLSFILVNKNKTDPLRAVNILTRKVMGHTMVSATEASSVTLNWQHREKESYCNFASFNRVVNTKTRRIQMGPNILNIG